MLSLDVCVVTWKTPLYLDQFLTSYESVARRESKLFLRANDPTTADKEIIGRHAEGDAVLSLGCNMGYAKSINCLAGMGSADIIGIFNADAVLSEDIWDCVEYMEQNPDIGVLGPRQTDGTRSNRLTCGGGVIGTQAKPEFRAWGKHNSDKYADIVDVVGVMGTAYFIRRSVWDELTQCSDYVKFLNDREIEVVGAFLPTRHWYEETFCTYHARAHGYRVVYYGPAQVIHYSKKSGDPPGGTKKTWNESKQFFREACDSVHQMDHE